MKMPSRGSMRNLPHSKLDHIFRSIQDVTSYLITYVTFNSSILVAREKPIISMLKKIRHQQKMRMNVKKEAAQRRDLAFGSRQMQEI